MKHLPCIVGGLLGALFIWGGIVGINMLRHQKSILLPPEPTAADHFNAAFGPTGYMEFVKVLEVIGGLLVAYPKTRNFGLLVLGPILVNIVAFHVFVTKGGLFEKPYLIPIICVAALYLLWAGRKQFAGLAGTRQNQP